MGNPTCIALVIPVFNYEARISHTLQQLARWQARIDDYEIRIVFFDDGSQDESASMIRKFIAQEQLNWQLTGSTENRGKGYAVRNGILAAYEYQPDIIIFTDCDLYYGLDIIQSRMVPALSQADIVLADRSLSRRNVTLPVARHIASAIFNRMVAILTGIYFKDTQAGLKGFRAKECRPLFDVLSLQGFAFDVELLSVAQYHRFRIQQLPVEFTDKPMEYLSTVSIVPASISMMADLFRINWNWKRGKYTTLALSQRNESTIFTIKDN